MPLYIDLILVGVMLILSFFRRVTPAEPIVLSILTAIFGLVAFIFIRKSTYIDEEGVAVSSAFSRKRLLWEQITCVDAVRVGRKIYLLLTTTKGFIVIPNTYEKFYDLVRDVASRVDAGRVERHVVEILDNPLHRVFDKVVAWGLALFFAVVIVLRAIA